MVLDQGKRSLSIIIPTLNEEDHLGAMLQQFCGRADGCELIVADGRSDDDTAKIARSHGARVVGCRPGRGGQMNRGAATATGDALLFVHADTRLPRNFREVVDDVLAKRQVSAGAFRLLIDAPGRSFRLIERMVDLRSRLGQLPYGDQALFITRDTFQRVGGFPPTPVMEDFALVCRLRQLGRVEIASSSVMTSARRWQASGVWRTTMLNQICLLAYGLGISPHRIARWRSRRPSSTASPSTMGSLVRQ